MDSAKINVMEGHCRYSEMIYGAIVGLYGYPISLLELGCGIGRNLAMFGRALYKTGIDPYWPNIEKASSLYSGIRFIHGTHESIKILPEKYDIGFTCSVMDHIEKPDVAIKLISEKCKHVVLFEPMIVENSRKAFENETHRWQDTWYHDYSKWSKRIISFPMYWYSSGPYFKMVVIK